MASICEVNQHLIPLLIITVFKYPNSIRYNYSHAYDRKNLEEIKQMDYQFFRQNGYVSLGQVLTGEELVYYIDLFDQDRIEKQIFWFDYSNHQTVNYDVLASTPEFDQLIRHPKLMGPIAELMGGELCFSEIGLRHMAQYESIPKYWAWHRDGKHLMEHPLRMRHIHLMLYLADVNETTHCFSISPESVDDTILENKDAQLKRGGIHNLYGPAGTAILFNYSVLHSATVRVTKKERKTVQIYYGHIDQPYMANDSIIPAEFWKNHDDPEVRAFYSIINNKTQKYLDLAGTKNRPIEQVAEILYELDYKNR